MKLTNVAIKNAKPKAKMYKMADGDGLCLQIMPKGSKLWRLRYRFDGKEKSISLGIYPTVSLKDARDRCQEARKLLSNDVDPSAHREAVRTSRREESQNTFEILTREWHKKNYETWIEGHAKSILARFEQNIFPWLGNKPISKINNNDLLRVLNRIEERGAVETAHRILQYCSKVCRYAVLTGRLDTDFTVGLKEALKSIKREHLAAITDPTKLSQLLRDIDVYEGHPITKAALQLAPLVFVRPGELRQAEWSEINFMKSEWHIPAEKMKMRQPHIVPLSEQAIHILREVHPISGNGKYIFPSHVRRTEPLSNNTLNMALRRMGYTKDEMTCHGFRAVARTLLDEVLGYRPDFIEHQLAHAVKDPNGRAYNRTSHLDERRKMMQEWAGYLDGLKNRSYPINISSRTGIAIKEVG